MSNVGRWVIWGLLPSLIGGLLLNFLIPFSSINSEVLTGVLTDPILRLGALTLILVVPMYFGVSYIIGLVLSLVDRRREIQKSNSPRGSSPPSKPNKMIWQGIVQQYGVDWFVIMGKRRGIDAYVYIERGPCCPECQTEMLQRNKTRFLVLKRRVWLCPECKKTVDRPKEMLFEEKRGVKNAVEKHVSVALSNNEPEKYIQSLDKLDTDQWGKQNTGQWGKQFR